MITQILSQSHIRKIHNASLTILEQVGVEVPHPEMLSRFADAGARVNPAVNRVRIPADLVTRLIGQAGKQFSIYGRDLQRTAAFGQGRRNYNSGAGEASWVDAIGGPRRYATMADVAAAARFGDALDGINVVGAMADPHELPVESRCVDVVASMIRNTTKPITFWYHDRASAHFINEMMKIFLVIFH